MTRRSYMVTPKRRRLISEALDMVAQTRRRIDPDLLRKARQSIAVAAENSQKHESPKPSPSRTENIARQDYIPIDRNKNMGTILKFLEMNPGNASLQKEISRFLGESRP